MDPLELIYENMDAVPEAFRGLYTEDGDKAVLTHVNGMKTQADITKVQEALRKEREDHSKAREALKPWKALGDDPAAVQINLDRMSELETAAGGKLDDAALNKMVEARLGQKTAPLERQLREIQEARDTLEQENTGLRGGMVARDRNDIVRSIATEMKVLPTAIADVEMVAGMFLERDPTTNEFIVKADVRGATPGGDVRTFLKDMQKSRPHWWPASAGGGAGGGGGSLGGDDNPWSVKGWSLTAQGVYAKEHGMAKAEAAAKAANSRIGATKATATAK